jgi:hypothetical protein
MSRALILVMRLPKGNNGEEDGNYNTKGLSGMTENALRMMRE